MADKDKGAHKSKAHQKAADSAYEDIQSVTTPDLKTLISQVRVAQEKKKQQNQKLSKKQLEQQKKTIQAQAVAESKRLEMLIKESEISGQKAKKEIQEIQASQEQQKKEVKDDLKIEKQISAAEDFEKKIKDLQKAVKKKTVEALTIGARDVSQLRTLWADAESAFWLMQSKALFTEGDKSNQIDKSKAAHSDLLDLKKQIDVLNRIARRNDTQRTEKDQVADAELSNSLWARLLSSGRKKLGSQSISKSIQTAASIFGRQLKTKASEGLENALGAIKQGASWTANKIGNGAVAALVKADKSIRQLGTIVKDVGKNSFAWLHKTMDSMFGYLKHKWNSLRLGSAGGLGTLVGLGMLFKSLILPMIQGINTKLEQLYGKNYVQTFISSMWDKAKDWMLTGVKNFLFGGPASKNDVGAAGATRKSLRGNLSVVNEPALGSLESSWGKVHKPLEQERLLSSSLRSMLDFKARGSKDEEQYRRNQIQFYLNRGNGLTINSLQPELYGALKAEGFNLSMFKNMGPDTGKLRPSAAAPSISANNAQWSTGSAKASGVPIRAQSSTSITTAKPPATSISSTSGARTKSTPTAPGLGNASIPNQNVSDGFQALNLGILGGY
jgi:hypothetical protein